MTQTILIESRNPATEELLQTYSAMSPAVINTIINQVNTCFNHWKTSTFTERSTLLTRLKQLLTARQETLAQMITAEMGKPITQARAEITKCIRLCDYYLEHAEQFIAPHFIATEYQRSYVCYQPLGIIFAIMPWNFPIWQVFRFLIPALMAGNAGLLKHAPNVTGCALLLESLVKDAGYPEHLFRVIITAESAVPQIIEHPAIRAITLTGSQRAGSAVAMQAGKALKKIVLELGGSDPYLILADAELESAVDACIQSRLNNAGQVCIAAKRILVDQNIYPVFKELLLAKLATYQSGNPRDESCLLGPLARADLRQTLHIQVTNSVNQGATLLLGGQMPAGKGFYYPVTVLENIPQDAPACVEELFGPVFSLMPFQTIAEAVSIANSLEYGLGAAIFTRDIAQGEDIAAKLIDVGACFVNAMVVSDPRLPFGGIKSSGFGRELGQEGLREFTNIKTICIR